MAGKADDWGLHSQSARLHVGPTDPRRPERDGLVAPVLERLVSVTAGADNVALKGRTCAHTARTDFAPYETPSPGDWSIHRGGAVFVDQRAGGEPVEG